MTPLLLNTTIKISLVLLVALVTTALLRHRSAALRHFVLAVALACAAVTPALRTVAPAWQTTSRLQIVDRPLELLDDAASKMTTGGLQASSPKHATTESVTRAVGILWMTGAGLAVLVLILGLCRLTWIAAHAERLVDGPWVNAADGIARGYRLRNAPLILLSRHAAVLGTWGLTRARVLLPPDACDWPADRMRIVLAHELAHVRRCDWLVQTAAAFLCAIYWFNPLVWLGSRRLRLESERACDDAVLMSGVDGSVYASELISLARAFATGGRLFVPAATIARRSSLERRVRAMLNASLNRDPLTRRASIAAALVLVAVTVLVAGFGVSAQAQFGSVSGTIADQHGRPIAGVRLVLSNPSAQTKHEVKSNAAGRFEIVGVPAGSYELTFEYPGMSTMKREGLNLEGSQPDATVNAVMRIGSIQETIHVTSAAGSTPALFKYQNARVAEKPDPCAASANGGCIRTPVKIKDVRPVFPAGSPGGDVMLEALIGVDGRVTNVDIVGDRSGGAADPSLANAAALAVGQWEFLPTRLDGQPVETRLKVHVTFTAAQ